MFTQIRSGVLVLAAFALLAGCGGGGDGAANPPPPQIAAPSALSYPVMPALTVGTAMTSATPTVTGSVASWQVSPALPAGLSLNPATGVVSGAPTAIAATANYTITATNAGGSTSMVLAISVNDAAPAISYGVARMLVVGNPVALVPTRTGGAVVSWSVTPTLPSGLALGSDGAISGTPTATGASASYTITATNSGGESDSVIGLGVESGLLMSLGHSDNVIQTFKSGSRVLSYDRSGVWALWDFATAGRVATGDVVCGFTCGHGVMLANDLFVVDRVDALELREAANGELAATIALATRPAWWKLATDASYVAAGTATGLTVWSRTGAVLLSRVGDYSQPAPFGSRVFAAPGELRIAQPAFVNQSTIIETIVLPAGSSTSTAALSGAFHSWFLDGERLLSRTGNTVNVYSRLGVGEDSGALTTVENLGGSDDFYWTLQNGTTLRWYVVGGGGTPTASLSGINMTLFPTATTLGIYDSVPNVFRLYTLATASGTTFNLPVRRDVSSYAQGAGSDWVLGLEEGVLVDGPSLAATPRFFAAGKARAIAAGTAYTSVATASGRVFVFDSATKAAVGVLNLDAEDIKASADGVTLAAVPWVEGPYVTDIGIRIFALPGTSPVHTWPGDIHNASYPFAVELSASGQILVRKIRSGGAVTREQTLTTGGPATWSLTTDGPDFSFQPVRLSPAGTSVAALLRMSMPDDYTQPTNLYTNGVLTGALQPAAPVVWLDDTRILTAKYRTINPAGGAYLFDGMSIHDNTGATQATPTLPEMARAQVAGATSIYSPELNVILSTVTGETSWSSPRRIQPGAGVGGVAGSRVVFVSRSDVRAEPR
jgi:hypothetical protein